MDEKCPDSFTVFNKEKRAITITRYELSTVLRVGENGVVQDRTRPMATKLNVKLETFKVLIEKIWGAKSMPNLSLVKNIQDGSAGFGDETLNAFGWADAKARGVGLLAFFCTLSQEQRKVLEDENRNMRNVVNPKTNKIETVPRSLADNWTMVNAKRPRTQKIETVPKYLAKHWTMVDAKRPRTQKIERVPKSTAESWTMVDARNPKTQKNETVPKYLANNWTMVDAKNPKTQKIERVPKYIANNWKYRKPRGGFCPLGGFCPSCEIKRSTMWALLPQTIQRFVQIGKASGYNITTEFVKRFLMKRFPGLSEEMFAAGDETCRRVVCFACFHSALKRWSEFVGAATITIPIR